MSECSNILYNTLRVGATTYKNSILYSSPSVLVCICKLTIHYTVLFKIVKEQRGKTESELRVSDKRALG